MSNFLINKRAEMATALLYVILTYAIIIEFAKSTRKTLRCTYSTQTSAKPVRTRYVTSGTSTRILVPLVTAGINT